MRATTRINGETIRNHNSIKELKKYLNEALYYCDEVYLMIPSLGDAIPYSEVNDIASLVRDVNFFEDEFLEVCQTF